VENCPNRCRIKGMSPLPTESDPDRPVERFKPTNGTFVGYAGLALALLAVVYVVLAVHTIVGLRVALGAMFAAAVVWVTQLRPRASAYPERLLLKGSLRDTSIPYVLIDEVALGQTLNIWVGGHRHVCIGIGLSVGKDMRQRAKKQRQTSLLGASRLHEFSEKAELAAPDQTAMSYHTFVVTRIEELVEQARKDAARAGAARAGAASGAPEVRRSYAVAEIVALVVTGLAFVAALFV
jgi:hypothetical protein